MIEITPKRLYIIGMVCFSIIGICNLYILLLNIKVSTFPASVASIAGIVFNFALVGLFKYMLSLEPTYTDEYASDDVNEIIKELKKK